MNFFKLPFTILILFFFSFQLFAEPSDDNKRLFQEKMGEILQIGGQVREISKLLNPANRRLYIHSQVPTIKATLKKSDEEINKIREEVDINLQDKDLHSILSDMCELQQISIKVDSELLSIYEVNGAITQAEYSSTVKKYEKRAKKLQKSLAKYKDM